MRQISLTDYFCKGLRLKNLVTAFSDGILFAYLCEAPAFPISNWNVRGCNNLHNHPSIASTPLPSTHPCDTSCLQHSKKTSICTLARQFPLRDMSWTIECRTSIRLYPCMRYGTSWPECRNVPVLPSRSRTAVRNICTTIPLSGRQQSDNGHASLFITDI